MALAPGTITGGSCGVRTLSGIMTKNFIMSDQSANHIIGLDLGGTKLAASLFSADEEGGGLAFVRSLKPLGYKELSGEDRKKPPPPEIGNRIKDSMLRMIGELSGGAGGAARAIGIATAGFIEGKTIVDAANVGIKMYPLGDRIEEETGDRTFLYKDSWAPAFAVDPPEPGIIFSVGTGFGGASCEPGMKIKILGHTACHHPVWIPVLRKNDDPGYAVAFSLGEMKEIFKTAAERSGEKMLLKADAAKLAEQLHHEAGRLQKHTPEPPLYEAAKELAPEAMAGWRPGEVFADFPGCAAFPVFVYKLLTGRPIKPQELDKLLSDGDPAAACSATVQAEFLACILLEMQQERIEFELPPARRIYGTGSGYNETTHRSLGEAIIKAYEQRAAKAGLKPPHPESVELVAPPAPGTTLAATGAAVGAWRGIEVLSGENPF